MALSILQPLYYPLPQPHQLPRPVTKHHRHQPNRHPRQLHPFHPSRRTNPNPIPHLTNLPGRNPRLNRCHQPSQHQKEHGPPGSKQIRQDTQRSSIRQLAVSVLGCWDEGACDAAEEGEACEPDDDTIDDGEGFEGCVETLEGGGEGGGEAERGEGRGVGEVEADEGEGEGVVEEGGDCRSVP